jgi:hypothetical protein
VQARLAERASSHSRRQIRRGTALGVGVLLCPDCGGGLSFHRATEPAQSLYRCSTANRGQNDCKSRAILASVAEAALLAEVSRLRGCDWNPAVVDGVLAQAARHGPDPRAELQCTLEAAERELQRHYRTFSLIEEPSVEEEETFRTMSREIAARIARHKAELARVPDETLKALDLKALHDQVMRTDIPALVERFVETGDTTGLRQLLGLLVVSATITERHPARRTRWARATVTWTPNVDALRERGWLVLGPEVTPPMSGGCP